MKEKDKIKNNHNKTRTMEMLVHPELNTFLFHFFRPRDGYGNPFRPIKVLDEVKPIMHENETRKKEKENSVAPPITVKKRRKKYI